jgi:hypothetical protein
MPYSEIEGLSSVGRIRKLLTVAKQNKIVLLQGRLKKEEETELIKATMEEINKDFKGIELAVIDPSAAQVAGLRKVRNAVFGMLLGDRQGMTIIGPASVVKEIKKDPTKIELLTKDTKARKKKVKKR